MISAVILDNAYKNGRTQGFVFGLALRLLNPLKRLIETFDFVALKYIFYC